MATLTQLETEVVEQIGSINATDDQTKIRRYLNDGVRYVLRNTHCYQTEVTVTPGAADNYTVASTILDIVDASFSTSSDTFSLERVSPEEIRAKRRSGDSTSGGPTRYYALAGANLMMFYPQPGASDTLSLLNVPAPTAMSSDSHDPSNATYGGIPVDYHSLIVLYACWWLAMYDDDSSSQNGRDYKALLDLGVAQAKREIERKGGHKSPRFKVGRRRFVPRSPSADYWR